MTQVFHQRRGGLYRSRTGTILGVCKGIARYFDLPVAGTRFFTCILLVFSGFWPVLILYFLAALLMKPEPMVPLETEEEKEFYHSYASSRPMALHRLRKTYDNLDRRLQRMEGVVTSREYDWERRLHR